MESNPLTAVEFFARRMSGCSITDAHRATGIAYTTIHDLAHAHVGTPRIETLRKLEAWSRAVGATHGVYLSASKTLGFDAESSDAEAAQ